MRLRPAFFACCFSACIFSSFAQEAMQDRRVISFQFQAVTPTIARATLAVMVGADASEALLGVVHHALGALSNASLDDERSAILKSASMLSERIRTAPSARDIYELANSTEGRKFELLSYVAPWDRATQKFLRDTTSKSRSVETIVDGILSRPLDSSYQRNVSAVLTAVALTDAQPSLDQIADVLVGKADRESGRRILLALSSADSLTEEGLREATKELASMTSQLLGRQAKELARAKESFQKISNFRSLDLSQIRDATTVADAASGTALVLGRLAAIGGSPQLARDINRGLQTVNSGLALYKSIVPLASLASGGTFVAAMGAMNAFGSGGIGGDAQDAQLMAALQQLTSLIRREFEVVNGKLDKMQGTLDQISDKLDRSLAISTEIIQQAKQTHNAVLGLYTRLDELERNLIEADAKLALAGCRGFAELSSSPWPTPTQFQTCAYIFTAAALLNLPTITLSEDTPSDADFTRAFYPGVSATPTAAWSHSSLVAFISSEYLGRPAAKKYVPASFRRPTSEAVDISSAPNAIAGSVAYLELWRRFASAETLRDKSTFIRVNGLARLADRLDQSSAFLDAVGSVPGTETKDIKKLLSLYEEKLAGEIRRVGTVNDGALMEILTADGKTFRKLTTTGIQLSRCTPPPKARPIPSMQWKYLDNAGVPLYFAQTSSGSFSKENDRFALRNSSERLPRLDFCYDWLPIRFKGDSNSGFAMKIFVNRAEIISKEARLAACPRANDWLFQCLARHASYHLASCKEDSVCQAKLDTAVREKYAKSRSNLTQLQLLALRARHLANSIAATQKPPLLEADSKLSALRGYLMVTMPNAYALHDSLRTALEGSDSARLIDSEVINSYHSCAAAILGSINVHELTADIRDEELSERVDRQCPWLSRSGSKAEIRDVYELQTFARKRLATFEADLLRTQWLTDDVGGADHSRLVALRLREFMGEK